MEAATAMPAAYHFLNYYLVTGSKCIKIFWALILLLAAVSNSIASSSGIVKNLPGFPGELPFLLETGYISVGEVDDEVQLFYYFIHSEGQPADDPLVLWLNTGPACSALYAIIYEIGPIGFDYERSVGEHKPVLVLNDYSWTKVANIIFLDAPVGTGFSYAETSAGYNSSDTKSTEHTYLFLRKWLLAHPEFQSNPVYIAGDSYSGITVPVVVKKISDGNEAGILPRINLKGYVLGNPKTDVQYDINPRLKFANRVGLLYDELYEETNFDCQGEYISPNNKCIEHLEIVNQCLKDIYSPMVLEPTCSFVSPKPNKLQWDSSHLVVNVSDAFLSEVNPIGRWCRNYNYLFINIWANDKEVQEALHVRDGTIKEWKRCNNISYVFDIKSSLDYHRSLTSKDLRAIVYSGDHDMLIPYVGTEEWIQSLNLAVSSDDEWRPWFVDGQVEGYVKIYRKKLYSITFATIKGAGHTAPEYKPKECFNMISRWFAYYFL